MALVTTRLSDKLTQKARSKLGIRFGRFTVAAIAAFVTTEVVLTICAGPLDLTATHTFSDRRDSVTIPDPADTARTLTRYYSESFSTTLDWV